jgi:hypothetical protein
MRSIHRFQMPALMASLFFAWAALAQPPERKRDHPPGPIPLTRINVDDIVEHIMSFDKNKDGKVTEDELPERMHHLIELGDTNKDGALDRDEIKKLATKLAATPGGFGAGGFQVAGPGPGAAGGFGGRVEGGIRVGTGPGPGPGAPVGFGISIRADTNAMEGVVDDLKLQGKKKDLARDAVKAHQENVRKLMDQARADLLKKMQGILSKEEFEDFKAALGRPRGGATFVAPPDAPRTERR